MDKDLAILRNYEYVRRLDLFPFLLGVEIALLIVHSEEHMCTEGVFEKQSPVRC